MSSYGDGCLENTVRNPKTLRCVSIHGNIGQRVLAEMKKRGIRSTPCPEGLLPNPKTGNCVAAHSKIGELLLRKMPKPPPAPRPPKPGTPPAPRPPNDNKNKRCAPLKIWNPDTRRCVLRTGKIGREVLRRQKEQRRQQQQRPENRSQPQKPDKRPIVLNDGPLATPRSPHSRNNINMVLTPRSTYLKINKAPIVIPKKVNQCGDVATFKQKHPVCWFMAVMAALFLSEGTRMMVARAVSRLSHKMYGGTKFATQDNVMKAARKYDERYERGAKKVDLDKLKKQHRLLMLADIVSILQGYDRTKEITMKHWSQMARLDPDFFLTRMHHTHSNDFVSGEWAGGYAPPYVRTMFEFLEIPYLFLHRSHEMADMPVSTFEISGLNCHLPYQVTPETPFSHKWMSELPWSYAKSKFYNAGNPEVIVLSRARTAKYTMQGRAGFADDVQFYYRKKMGRQLVEVQGALKNAHATRIRYRGRNYRLDSMILTSEPNTCSGYHDIAGVTCRGERFMFNGWSKQTIDPAMAGVVVHDKNPCPLMPLDWATIKSVVIDPRRCVMRPRSADNAERTQDFNTHDSVLIYVKE